MKSISNGERRSRTFVLDFASGKIGIVVIIIALFLLNCYSISTFASVSRQEIVFIEDNLVDYQVLVKGMKPGLEVQVLKSSGDGLTQMVEWAQTHTGYDAMHVISHGAKGIVSLGTFELDIESAGTRAEDMNVLGEALTPNGDMLLYSCEVASGEGGKFVAAMAEMTGADVAASTDFTGSVTLKGNWDLEYKAGAVDTDICLTNSEIANYQHILPVPISWTNHSSISGYGEVYGPPNYMGTRPGGTGTVWRIPADQYYSLYISGTIPNGRLEFSTDNGGTWSTVGINETSGSTAGVAPPNSLVRFVHTGSTSDTNSIEFYSRTYKNPADKNNSGFYSIKITVSMDNVPTDINVNTNRILSDASEGEAFAKLTPVDTGSSVGGDWEIVSQSVANLVNISHNPSSGNTATLSIGTGIVPPAESTFTVDVRYYDPLQTDLNGDGIAGQGYTKTLTFEVVEEEVPLAGFGSDTAINLTTADKQETPAVARLSDGNYAVVWRSERQSNNGASGGSIIARVFDSYGQAVGNEIQVSPTDFTNVFNPAVTALGNGKFAVAYQTGETYSGLGDVVFRIIEANGTVGDEVTANSVIDGEQSSPDTTTLSDGSMVIAWVTDQGDGGRVCRRFTSNGVAIDNNDVELSTSDYASWGGRVSVALLSNGGFVAVWADNLNTGTVLARIFDGTSLGEPFEVANSNGGLMADVATLSEEGFIVAYDEWVDGSPFNLKFKRFSSLGEEQGSETTADTLTNTDNLPPLDVIGLADGGFMIGWTSDSGDYHSKGVFGRRYNSSGVAIDNTSLQLNAHRRNGQFDVAQAPRSTDSFIAVWTDTDAEGSGNSGIEGRFAVGDPSDMGVTSVTAASLTQIEVTMPDIGLVYGDFALTDNSTSGIIEVTNATYANGKYTLTVSGMSYADTYTLTIIKTGYNAYTNNQIYYGTLATTGDLDLVHEPNIFDTYTRGYSDGVVTINNNTYAANALLYSGSSLYTAIDTTNGNSPSAAIGDYKVVGAFVIAPLNAKGAKSLYSNGEMTQLDTDSLIDSNPNYMETVAVGQAANDNNYWETIAFAPVYMKTAIKQADSAWLLNDPADRLRIIEWYDNAECTGTPMKVVRFMMKVEYTGTSTGDAGNSAPVLDLNGTAADTGNTVTLANAGNGLTDAAATVSDTENDSSDWSNSSLTVERVLTGGDFDGSVNDIFSFLSSGTFSVTGTPPVKGADTSGTLTSSGTAFADWTYTSASGKLLISFNSNASTALVQDVVRHIGYSNATPYGDATVRFALSDGTDTINSDVQITSSTIYVDQTDLDTQGDAADGFNLTEALAKAVDGDTILIQDGTYRGQFVATTAVTIDAVNGAGGNVTLEAPDTVDLVKSDQDFLTNNGRWRMPILDLKTVTPGSGTVTVKNLNIDGRFQAVVDEYGANKDLIGIGVFDTNAIIDHVNVQHIASLPNSSTGEYLDQPEDFGIVVEGSSALSSKVEVTIKNSTIGTFQKTGIIAWGPMLNVVIQDNTITGVGVLGLNGVNGMQIGSSDANEGFRAGTTATISGNMISEMDMNYVGPDYYMGSGIILRQTGEVEIKDNTISVNTNRPAGSNGSVGIDLLEITSPIDVHDNVFDNIRVGIYLESHSDILNNGYHTIADNNFSSSYQAVLNTLPATGADNRLTITQTSSATVTNDRGFLEFGLSNVDDTFTDIGAAPSHIEGGTGNDTISAGSGADMLTGGAGDDTLTGGDGDDVFSYAASDNGVDTISDFGSGDAIQVSSRSSTGGAITLGDGSSVAVNSVQTAVSGSTTTLYIDSDGAAGTAEVEITLTGIYTPNNFILDGEYIRFAATSALTVNSYTPTSAGTEVAVDANLVLTFSENVTATAGKNIVIKQAADDSVVETIEANDGKVTVSGSTVTINLSVDLYYSTGYYVQIEAGAFKDAGNNDYEGISDSTTWGFTTEIRPEVTVNTSEELAHYLSNPSIAIINLVNGTTYQYEGGTIATDLTINGNGAVLEAGEGVNDTVVRSDDVTVSSAALGNYANVKTFLKVEGMGSALKLNDVILRNGSNKNGTDNSNDGIFAVINVKTNGSLDMDNVTLEDFHNNPTLGENFSFGIHAEPGALSTTIQNSSFESSNAFRNAVAIRKGTIQLSNNTFKGTDYPERLRQSDGYEYALYIYGGNGTITQNTITGYDSTTQLGYASAGIAVIGFYSTEVTIEDNTLSYNESGIDITLTWSPWSTNTQMSVNGQTLSSSEEAYAIGEALKAANTQDYVSVSLDQNDEVEVSNSSGEYFTVLGGYRSPFLTVIGSTGTTATVQLPITDIDTLNAADAIEFEKQEDGDTDWSAVDWAWSSEPTEASLTLETGHDYQIRVKLTHTSYAEPGDSIARTLITYSNPVAVTASLAPSITTQPTDQTVTEGQPVTFNVVAAGEAPLSYQWKKDGNDLSGATTSTYMIAAAQASDAGSYIVEVSNTVSSVTSSAVTLTVNPASVGWTVTFNSQGGSAVTSLSGVTTGSAISAPQDPTRTGYTFGGWYKESNCTNVWNFSSDSVTNNVTIFAKWTANTSSSHGGNSGSTPTSTPTTVSGKVIDKTGELVKGVEARVTVETNGTSTVAVKSNEAILLKQPDGTKAPLSDSSKLGFLVEGNTDSNANAVVTLSADGTIQVKNLANGTESRIAVMYDLGNGQKITIGTIDIKVGSNGEVSLTSTLIDPYGTITDAATGKVITGADVTLYYANTARNIASGKTPDTLVALPIINGFKPNNNKNPQISDLSGAYGFMVFPTTDYYIVATKEGYDQFRSPTIPVEQEIVKLDFKMNQPKLGLTRLAGLTSVDTALEIAKANYTEQVSNVILTTAENFSDALAGSVLAYKLNAPILLVGSSEEDQTKVITYLKDYMNPKGTVYILGGTAAVSKAVEGNITANGFSQIKRLGGYDQYETALRIAEELDLLTGTPIVLAYGENYPDALSVSSAAAAMQYPILLVGNDGISAAVQKKIAAINPIRVYIIGGQAVISSAVENQVSELTSLGKGAIVRLNGVDRYETSLAVANYFKLSGQTVCVATGNNFPDALTGSVYGANSNAPIIIADIELSEEIKEYLKTRRSTRVCIFGGEAVISKAIEQEIFWMLSK